MTKTQWSSGVNAGNAGNAGMMNQGIFFPSWTWRNYQQSANQFRSSASCHIKCNLNNLISEEFASGKFPPVLSIACNSPVSPSRSAPWKCCGDALVLTYWTSCRAEMTSKASLTAFPTRKENNVLNQNGIFIHPKSWLWHWVGTPFPAVVEAGRLLFLSSWCSAKSLFFWLKKRYWRQECSLCFESKLTFWTKSLLQQTQSCNSESSLLHSKTHSSNQQACAALKLLFNLKPCEWWCQVSIYFIFFWKIWSCVSIAMAATGLTLLAKLP